MLSNFFRIALGVLLAAAACAEQADRDKPMEITSDKGCTMDQVNSVSTCAGNVVIVKGTLQLKADKVVVTQDEAGNQTMVATGKIVTFQQKLEDKDEWVEGQSSRLDYNSKAHLVVLTGNARVKRGQDLVVGHVITYDTVRERYQVTGGATAGPNKGRVTVILQPKTTSEIKR